LYIPTLSSTYRKLFYSTSINWGDYKNVGQLLQYLARFEPTASQNETISLLAIWIAGNNGTFVYVA